ncbi:hypothetical protein HAX54_051673 [Datura stramonium]|uniref:Uncharacterized protein n=1 Tax=Datura stramonium TaxID=4076 RepID=A0ABS8WQH0_DATST|nr:hypothetical protein [Datura stramonium]
MPFVFLSYLSQPTSLTVPGITQCITEQFKTILHRDTTLQYTKRRSTSSLEHLHISHWVTYKLYFSSSNFQQLEMLPLPPSKQKRTISSAPSESKPLSVENVFPISPTSSKRGDMFSNIRGFPILSFAS